MPLAAAICSSAVSDVLGLFSNYVVPFSLNVAPKPRMLSVRADYVLGSLQLPSWVVKRDGARTLRISLSAPHLPGFARENSEHD
jgi:hypothetical protein